MNDRNEAKEAGLTVGQLLESLKGVDPNLKVVLLQTLEDVYEQMMSGSSYAHQAEVFKDDDEEEEYFSIHGAPEEVYQGFRAHMANA